MKWVMCLDVKYLAFKYSNSSLSGFLFMFLLDLYFLIILKVPNLKFTTKFPHLMDSLPNVITSTLHCTGHSLVINTVICLPCLSMWLSRVLSFWHQVKCTCEFTNVSGVTNFRMLVFLNFFFTSLKEFVSLKFHEVFLSVWLHYHFISNYCIIEADFFPLNVRHHSLKQGGIIPCLQTQQKLYNHEWKFCTHVVSGFVTQLFNDPQTDSG